MKRLAILAASTALAACATTPTPVETAAAPAMPAETAAAAPAKPEIGTFGLDVGGMDRSTAAGEDWVQFANGTYARTLEIPADKASYGMFNRLDELSRERTREIIDAAAAAPAAAGTNAQKVGDFYKAFMDEAAIEGRGAAPLAESLQPFQQAGSKSEFARALGDSLDGFGPALFPFYINQDAKAPDRYIPIFLQGGLGMPDRDYYLSKDAKLADARAKYVPHVARMLALSGVPQARATAAAQSVLDFETKLARVHWTRVESRDDDKTYNKWSRADFARRAPGFDWNAYLTAAGLEQQGEFIASQPSAFAGMAKAFASTPLQTLKDWATLHTARDAAGVLPKAFTEERFDFSGRTLQGTPEIEPRWKRGVNAVNGAIGEAVGELYVSKHFPPETKAKADELVKNITAAMDRRLSNLPWMTPDTRTKARAKLASFRSKIGYPDKWIDYSALTVTPGDAYGNVQRATAFDYARQLSKLGKPVDRDEWFMTPMTVNAYANPTMNEIVFPAAILQPPFFDPNADDAINYGGIGAVIGHEISHHFDDQGRKYDPQGRLTDWWTTEDVRRFEVYAGQLADQYSKYEPLQGQFINGRLALGENIADLAGLLVAHDAYRLSLGGKEAPVIEGFTGDQRFFLGHAQIWRTKYRENAMRQQLVTGPHSPGNFRPYVARNLDPWYQAFAVQPGQKLYLAPEQRVRVW
ncbi:M13-type metalloendopeptidase [uncultured Sphingomonas sp.]|uniref:M13 family metallopeptidase n=1 Tax=uncultured Sphingomonas sp. TaxID=158754 RepID=UPI0025F692B2|nr:M13-type metalloendopeptidase [uncultured Sphingomonas sp.]